MAWVRPTGLLDPCFVSNKGGRGSISCSVMREFTSLCFVDYFMAVIAIHCATPIVSVTTFVKLKLLDLCGHMRVIFVLALLPPAYLQTHTSISGFCSVPTKPIGGKMD